MRSSPLSFISRRHYSTAVTPRRLVGLITGISVLHLSLVGADLACATHVGPAAPGASDVHANQMLHPANATPRERSPQSPVPCDAPSRPDCCLASASCSVTLAVAGTVASPANAVLLAGAVVREVHVPLSRRVAPEPPPPKA